ncbi:MAG: hypothetical protein ACJ8FY_24755 [Gemmataceae bacterium]
MSQTSGPILAGKHPVPDDIHDPALEWPLIAERIGECQALVEPVFDKADAAALSHQKTHQRLTKVAAVSATFAVVLAIVELPRLIPRDEILVFAEVLAALAALLAVVLGLVASQLNHWLVERYKAERCRLLKFAYLIDPVIWGSNQQKKSDRVAKLREDVSVIDKVQTIEEPQKWLTEVHRPAFLTELGEYQGDEQVLRQLIGYYRATRLHAQIEYFGNRIKRFAFRDRVTRILPQWLFFISVLAAFVHFSVLFLQPEKSQEAHLSAAVSLALLAAVLPVFGAGIRTYRMANEFGRNVKRFESTRHVLSEMDHWLEENVDAKTALLTLWSCEHTLEIEQREWLRLMAETEWFG